MRILSAIADQAVARSIFTHLGLPAVARRRQATDQDAWYENLAIVPPGETGKAPRAELAFDTKLGASIKGTPASPIFDP